MILFEYLFSYFVRLYFVESTIFNLSSFFVYLHS
uniref:Uncharacterized protein n=1 Tax=Arundo donax TaxID=35708 RepID=A0A0A9ET09_ARUDO